MYCGTKLWADRMSCPIETLELSDHKQILTYPDLPENLYQMLCTSVQSHADKPAIIDNYERSCSYKDLKNKVDAFAAWLHPQVSPGCHVALMLYNSLEFCVAFLALIKLRAVTVPLPTKYKQPEVTALLNKADVSYIICDQDFEAWFSPYKAKGVGLLVSRDAEQSYGLAAYTAAPELAYTPAGTFEEPVILMFTSGTTSQSKGVLLYNFNMMNAIVSYQKILEITDQDIGIVPIPLYLITGLVALLGLFLYAGGTLYLHKIFRARRVLETIRDHHVTFLHAAPTVYSMLLEQQSQFPSLPSVTRFACGGGNMPKEKLAQMHNWFPNAIFHTVYGLTETTSPATIFPDDAPTSPYIGSSGLPIPGTCFEIRDEAGAPMGPGQIGEVWISGSVVLPQYYRMETPSLHDGWLGTGDLGYFNEAGYLFIVDRKKDMINHGGEKIWSYDVENELYLLDGVREAAVVGLPHPVYGEIAAAMVVPEPDCALDAETILFQLKPRMAKYKLPQKILLVDALPLTPNGKVNKREIKRIFAQQDEEPSIKA